MTGGWWKGGESYVSQPDDRTEEEPLFANRVGEVHRDFRQFDEQQAAGKDPVYLARNAGDTERLPGMQFGLPVYGIWGNRLSEMVAHLAQPIEVIYFFFPVLLPELFVCERALPATLFDLEL